MSQEQVIQRATFNPKVKTYFVINASMIFLFSIIGIPLLLIWIPLAFVIADRYLKSLSCVLTNRSVKLKSGIMIKQEKTIPLDKITDLGLAQGPIMRALDIERISVETAGSTTPGALASLVGVNGGREFRDAVMSQKELLAAESQGTTLANSPATPAHPTTDEQLVVLKEIRDSLNRIEQAMTKP